MSLRTLVPRSIAVAWAATVIVAFVVSLVFSLVAGFSGNSPIQWQDVAMAPIFALVAASLSAFLSLGIALVFGIPMFYAMRKMRLASTGAYLTAGGLLSMVSLALLYGAYHLRIFLYGQPWLIKIAVTISLVAGPVAALTIRKLETAAGAA